MIQEPWPPARHNCGEHGWWQAPTAGARSDSDIAEAASHALRWHAAVSDAPITPVVRDGWITLGGEVTFGYQKSSAEYAVRHLMGVRGITNDITVASPVAVGDVKQKIEDALKRHAIRDAKDIEVKVDESTVTLEGHVNSWQEHDDAATAAWAAPGVTNVKNALTVY